MATDSTVIAGIEIPSTSVVFLSIVGFHVLVALVSVIVGVVAMSSDKRSKRHPRFGAFYFWFLALVFASATALSVMRWNENAHLFFLGLLAFGSAWAGRSIVRRRGSSGLRLHLTCMGSSYIFLLTAFYVDNGKNLPLWRELPTIVYWVLPALVGIPLISWALVRHPLVRRTSSQSEG